ncbi:MAG: heme utilization protein, partial [Sphaerotilus sp.]
GTAQIAALTTAQVLALETRDLVALGTAAIHALSTADIVALNTAQVGVLTSTQIATFTTAQVMALETADLHALNATQVHALNTADIHVLTTAQISGLGTVQVAAFTTAHIQALTTADIVAFNTSHIAAFTTAQIAALTTVQVMAMETQDIHALSTSQALAFDSVDIAAMSSAQIDALPLVTPIVLDLDGNGIHTLAASHGVHFDLAATGVAHQVGWVSSGDGLLVRDINGDGLINDGRELFGMATQLASGAHAGDGYAALRALDSNHDGKLSAADAHFSELKVWVDANSNGVADAGELKSLADLGIVSMDLTAQTGSHGDNGNVVAQSSSYTTADGQTHQMADVWFAKAAAPEVSDAQGPATASAPTTAADLLVAAPETPLADTTTAAPTMHAALPDVDLLASQASAQALEELLRQQPIL